MPISGVSRYLSEGLASSVHVCSLIIALLFVVLLALVKRELWHVLLAAGAFIGTVFLTTISIGLGDFSGLLVSDNLPVYSRIAYLILGVLAVIVGILSFFDWFNYQKAGDPNKFILRMPRYTDLRDTAKKALFSIFLVSVSVFVAFSGTLLSSVYSVSTKFTGMLYVLSAQGSFTVVVLGMILYSFAFIVPLLMIFMFFLFYQRSQNKENAFLGDLSKIKIITAAVFLAVGSGLLFTFR